MPCRARGLLITCGLASTHTPGSFEVHCFSLMAAPDDALQLRLRRDCGSFVELEMLSHAEAARRINQDDVHVLIDMMGHTRFNRLQILSMQVSPRLFCLCNRACVCDRHTAQTQTIFRRRTEPCPLPDNVRRRRRRRRSQLLCRCTGWGRHSLWAQTTFHSYSQTRWRPRLRQRPFTRRGSCIYRSTSSQRRTATLSRLPRPARG